MILYSLSGNKQNFSIVDTFVNNINNVYFSYMNVILKLDNVKILFIIPDAGFEPAISIDTRS